MQPGSVDKKPVKITVCGQSFTVLAPGDPAEILQLAGEIDEIMTRIAARSGAADSMRAAILTCMHLADRNHALERELKDMRRRIEDKARRFAAILDETGDTGRRMR
jgi:cell division protein ZapA (FtsZ GTPase activity inhibitor)